MNTGLIIILVLAIAALLLTLLKLYVQLTKRWNKSATCLVGKTVIVTGANTGIGFYTAQDFAKRGARVILACRNPVKGEEARLKIIEATKNPHVVLRIVDLASLASVRKFVVQVKAKEKRLDILVNNAGAGGFNHSITSDGLSLIVQTNHFGPFLLTVLLIKLLRKSAPSRVVNVASGACYSANLNIDDLNAFPTGTSPRAVDYANTKLCNILFSNELARRLKGTAVDVNSVNPGVVRTKFFRNFPRVTRKIAHVLGTIFANTAEEGAQTSIYVAISKEISGQSGKFFYNCKEVHMPKAASDEELARRLWNKSETFVKLTVEEANFYS